MSMSQKKNEPKQKTPKGQEIPVPKRDEFLRDLRKVSKANESQAKRRSKQ